MRTTFFPLQRATRKWMAQVNAPRSGDKKTICWMVKDKEEFYFEDYRSATGQKAIIAIALDCEETGDKLRHDAASPTNSWLRNVKTYIGHSITSHSSRQKNTTHNKIMLPPFPDAKDSGSFDEISVHELRPEGPVDVAVLVAAGLAEVDADKDWDKAQEVVVEEGPEESDVEGSVDGKQHNLYPRSYDTFYGNVLKSMRLWKRPPHDNCERCEDYTTTYARRTELTAALGADSNNPEYETFQKIVKRAGGEVKAQEENRTLEHRLVDLKRHVCWRNDQRKYLVRRRTNMGPTGLELQLDYGGFTDSGNNKVSVWSATVMAKGREQEHFDFFFDASDAKKNGQTGIFFLGELLDPRMAPLEGQKDKDNPVCLLKMRYPELSQMVLSGDTGNGYRAYEMLEELSKLFEKFGIDVELIPLSPGHAWNRTDARIAHMNTFLRGVKAKGRIYGACNFATAFAAASNPTNATKRKFMARSFVFFRVVAKPDGAAVTELKKQFGAQLVSKSLMDGHVGVKSLLYFDFSFELEGGRLHPQGYARVREHGNPDTADNPTYVYTWRKDFAKHMCQPCSDRAVSTLNTHIYDHAHTYPRSPARVHTHTHTTRAHTSLGSPHHAVGIQLH
jgi:hypothetical protein